MRGSEVAPFALQVFHNQAAMAMLRRGFAAKQHGRHAKEAAIDPIFDAPLGHQRKKTLLVVGPGSFFLLVGVQQLLRGRQERLMDVVGGTDLLKKELQVVALAEAGELRDVVQSDIDQSLDSISLEDSEELGGRLLGKTDRKDFHASSGVLSYRSGCTSSFGPTSASV